MVELTTEQFEAARARGEARLRGPRAESARYDAGRGRVIVRLTTGVEVGFAPRDAEGLQYAKRDDLTVIEVDALGLGIHFPRLDADFYVPALLDRILGSKGWIAARSSVAKSRSGVSTEPALGSSVVGIGQRRKAGRP